MDLFEHALARNADPQTSHEAAARVGVNEMEQMVLATLRTHGPQTTTEIAALNRTDRDSISPRMKGLVERGLVKDTGETRVPPGKSRQSIVWAATTQAERETA